LTGPSQLFYNYLDKAGKSIYNVFSPIQLKRLMSLISFLLIFHWSEICSYQFCVLNGSKELI